MFRPFYRPLGTGVDGSGLGLAIVREIAARHGAEVTLADAEERRREAPLRAGGVGALFTVRFIALRNQRPDEIEASPVRPAEPRAGLPAPQAL